VQRYGASGARLARRNVTARQDATDVAQVEARIRVLASCGCAVPRGAESCAAGEFQSLAKRFRGDSITRMTSTAAKRALSLAHGGTCRKLC
jgi:hypothetical protein